MLSLLGASKLGSLATYGSLEIPETIAGLELWLDASDASSISTAGTGVDQWNDKSGNGRHAQQSTDANRPSTGTRTINSLNAIDFNGSSDYMDLASEVPYVSGEGLTMFAVIYADDLTTTTSNIIFGTTASGGIELRVDDSPTELEFVRADQAVLQGTGGNDILINNTYVTLGAASSSGQSLSIDGSTNAGSGTNPSFGNGVSRIGSSSGLTGKYWNGLYGEMIVYNDVISVADRNIIGNYLADKWGTTWTDLV